MELWIRSQNREILKQVYHLDMYSLLDEEEGNCWIVEDSGTELGTYKSKKRALEVLDEIEKTILNIGLPRGEQNINIFRHITFNMVTQLAIYEMPEK